MTQFLGNSELLHAKQFIGSQDPSAPPPGGQWQRHSLSDLLTIFTHPALEVGYGRAENTDVLLLGMALDPDQPTQTNSGIATDLAKAFASHGLPSIASSHQLRRLGGRFALIVRKGTTAEVHPDALGSKPIYFTHRDGKSTFASTPSLLYECGFAGHDQEAADEFLSFPNSGSWPIGILPYPGVTQVTPNSYLDILSGRRFRLPLIPPGRTLAVEDLVPWMTDRITRLFRAASSRSRLTLPLTAGFDSRLLLATFPQDHYPDTRWVTVVSGTTSSADRKLPARIARQLSLRYQFVTAEETPESLLQQLDRNVGGLLTDRTRQRTSGFQAAASGSLFCSGNGPEVFRHFYDPNNKISDPGSLSARDLANLAGFPDNPYAREGFASWRSDLSDASYGILDLLYWEHRMGVWQSSVTTFREAIMEEFMPINSREIIEASLSTSLSARVDPYRLHRELIRYASPWLSTLPYNSSNRWSAIAKQVSRFFKRSRRSKQ